jgi:hypothetical protein
VVSYGDCFTWARSNAGCAKAGSVKVETVVAQMNAWVSFYGPLIKGFYLDHFLPYSGYPLKTAANVNSILVVSQSYAASLTTSSLCLSVCG